MDELWYLILLLALGTFCIRLGGYMLAQFLPNSGAMTRILNALPGTIIASLLTVLIVQMGPREWVAALLALLAAVITRNLPVTMVVGIGTVWILRSFVGS